MKEFIIKRFEQHPSKPDTMTKTIKTDSYYLLVDTEAPIDNSSDHVVCNTASGKRWLYLPKEFHKDLNVDPDYWKVIAHLPIGNAPLLEGVPVLPELPDLIWEKAWKIAEQTGIKDEQQLIYIATAWYDGYHTDKVELPKQEEDVPIEVKAAKRVEKLNKIMKEHNVNQYDENSFIEGALFGASQGKKYTEEQMREALAEMYNSIVDAEEGDNTSFGGIMNRILLSLSPVQEQWEFEPEWEHFDLDMDSGDAVPVSLPDKTVLKVINNPENYNNPILVGKWIKNKIK